MNDAGGSGVTALAVAEVRAALAAVATARAGAEAAAGAAGASEPQSLQRLLEANAAAVIESLPGVRLADDYAVRYCVFAEAEQEVRVRPFVARRGTDVDAVRAALAWHPAPDCAPTSRRHGADRDVDLLYRHFSFASTPIAVFQYWLAIQEIWASTAWVHTTVLADASDFATIVANPDWRVEIQPDSYQPVVASDGFEHHVAALLYSPLRRHTIAMQTVTIDRERRVVFGDAVTVAVGPRGYHG